MSIEVPQALLEKHNIAGPRYTSYPTIPIWSAEYSADEYRRALQTLNDRKADDLSIYIHLPFCASHCHYCGCNSIASQKREVVEGYLDRVERELEMVTGIIGTGRRIVQIHWGGGTPNYLNDAQLERALNLFKTRFTLDTHSEVSLEVDPRISNPEQIAHLRKLGFNRISLGVQDFERNVQEAIGRIQSKQRTLDVFKACRESGFEGVNLDIVYGLPEQTGESFKKTLASIIGLKPDRVACFSYAHVPWVKPQQKLVKTGNLPNAYDKFSLFQTAIDMFNDAGYDWIGIDHFALRQDELSIALRERRLHRNFMGYTTRPAMHMLAFGMSAISEIADCFVQNNSDLQKYYDAIDAGGFPIVRGHTLTRDDRMRRMAIIHLMCNLELPYNLTIDEFGAGLDALLPDELHQMRKYEEEGFLIFESDKIRVTELGRFFVRNVCMELDAYLDRDSGSRRFSKTI
ncbi:MAG: oxygen-independent coproporphyrinogen III oxidase [Candidatus Eisenbacteria bacterium]|nr:oxygen-independent coproporphyrinogen III oxidase [Candidatus Eisenbacteria bacterium]